MSRKTYIGAGVAIVDNTFDAKALAGYVDVSDLLDVWIDDHKGLRKVGMLARTGLRRSCDEHALMRGGCPGQSRAISTVNAAPWHRPC